MEKLVSLNELEEDLQKAVKLAKWLIEKQGVKKKTAYIIASRKFKIPFYNEVRRAYNAIRTKQVTLF